MANSNAPAKKFTKAQQDTIDKAISIIESTFKSTGIYFRNSKETMDYCRLKLTDFEHEVFAILYLTNKNELINFDVLFRGSIRSSSVYLREVLKEALKENAGACIFTHNHPTGNPEPSKDDIDITHRLVIALEWVEIMVLDHIIVGSHSCVSFADRGLLQDSSIAISGALSFSPWWEHACKHLAYQAK